MKIKIPEGYTLPEDVQDGGTLEELVTFKVEGDYLVPTMIAGVEIPSDEEKPEEETPEEEGVEGYVEEETSVPEAPPKGKKKAMKGRAAALSGEPMGNIGRRIMGGMAMV